MLNLMIFSMVLIFIISLIFNMMSKNSTWDKWSSSSFECGFTSYFFSRFSYSIHYFLIGLIFLFLDLELCFLMPMLSESIMSVKMVIYFTSFIMFILIGLLEEWKEGNLDWIY